MSMNIRYKDFNQKLKMFDVTATSLHVDINLPFKRTCIEKKERRQYIYF